MVGQQTRNPYRNSFLGSFKLLMACATVMSIFTASYVLDDRPYSSPHRLVKYCSAIMWPVVVTKTHVVRPSDHVEGHKRTNLLSMSLLPAEKPNNISNGVRELQDSDEPGKEAIDDTPQQKMGKVALDKPVEREVKEKEPQKEPQKKIDDPPEKKINNPSGKKLDILPEKKVSTPIEMKIDSPSQKKSDSLIEKKLDSPSEKKVDNSLSNILKTENIKSQDSIQKVPSNQTKDANSLPSVPKPMAGTKYIFYLCDNKVYCFGLGDRQRAIAGLYLLAMVTNRKFGLIMTDPSPFTDLYQPNEVQWIIPEGELKGKTTKEVVLFGKSDFDMSKLDLDQAYPEDVVYFRTNYHIYDVLPQNPLYKDKLPQVPRWHLYALAWTTLVRPTDFLREALNAELKNIVTDMAKEFILHKKFDMARCDISCENGNISKSDIASKGCINVDDTRPLLDDLTPNFCVVTPPTIQPRMLPRAIMALKGHATVDIDLVCVHVRLGKTATFFWEKKPRNKAEDLPAVWDFLQPYVDKGHHVYVATDAQEVREIAKAKFGHRLHVSPQPIVHIAKVQEGQDKKEGFRLTAMEQLMMSTSCKVLMISYSNLSLKAAMVRAYIHTEKELYLFRNGKVVYFNPRRLF